MGRGKDVSDSQIAQIHELRASWMNQRQIAERLGCSQASVSRVLRRHHNNAKNNREGRSNGEQRNVEDFTCFFCLSCKPEHFQSSLSGGYRVTQENVNILLKYLLDTRNNKNELLIKDIHAMGNNQGIIMECDNCKEKSWRIAELHQELEKTQMKIVHELKLVKRKILQNFVNGSGGEELCKILESLVTTALEDRATGAAATPRDQRKLLELIADFQIAVDEKGKGSVDVPCVILDKFAFSHHRQMNDVEDFNVTVKTETLQDFTSNDADDFSDHFNDDMNTYDEPQCNGRRRTASARARYLISEVTQSSQEQVVSLPRKSKCSLPRRKYTKRVKGASKVAKGKIGGKEKKGKIYRVLSCELCSHTTRIPYNYEHHLNIHNATLRSCSEQPAQFTCAQCSKSFFSKQLYTFHMDGHQRKFTITCNFCEGRIPYPEIEAHVRTHTDNVFSCVNCSFCCTTREKQLDHLRYHSRGSILECDLCGKPYRSKAKLLRHLCEEHQVGQKLVCDVENCKQEFFDPIHLRIHKRIHISPHECAQCGKVYGNISRLRVHQRSHTGEKAFHCNECNESFRAPNSLHSHKILVHGAEKFKCEYCSKEYMSRGHYVDHLTTHDNTGIPCGICDKVLRSKSLWRRHQIAHSSEYSHICDQCGKGFTCQAKLKRHSAIHGGEKKYKCQFCGKAFLYTKYLVDHERTHTGERPFTCEICGQGFSQSGSLSIHRRKAHPDYQMD